MPMSARRRRIRNVLLCGVGIAIFYMVLIRGIPIEEFKDDTVSGGEYWRPWTLILVHLDNHRFIKVDGKRFSPVKGFKPYYIRLPELNSLLFVTREGDDHSILWLYNLSTRHFTRIDGGTTMLGSGIGTIRSPGGPAPDHFENVTPEQMTGVSESWGWREKIKLDLEKGVVEVVEHQLLDGRGNVTNSYSTKPSTGQSPRR